MDAAVSWQFTTIMAPIIDYANIGEYRHPPVNGLLIVYWALRCHGYVNNVYT
jgi:hypothetical protein